MDDYGSLVWSYRSLVCTDEPSGLDDLRVDTHLRQAAASEDGAPLPPGLRRDARCSLPGKGEGRTGALLGGECDGRRETLAADMLEPETQATAIVTLRGVGRSLGARNGKG